MRNRARAGQLGAAFCALAILSFALSGLAWASEAESHGGPAAHEGQAAAGEGSAHGEAHGSGLKPLAIYGTNFTIFLIALILLGRKPLTEVLRARRAGIVKGMEEAAGEKERAEKLLAEVEGKLKRVEEEARGILEQAEREGRAEQDRILAEARAATERMRRLAEFTIDQERKKAILAVREEAAKLAVELAGKLVQEKMTEEDHRRLIQDFLEHVRGEA